jgi:hypothetical protein
MTGDEMERAIEFLLKNQANFDARFKAERAETNQQIRDLAAAQQLTQVQLNHLTEVVAKLAEGQRRNSDDIEALVKLAGGIIEGRGNGGSTGN